jgi:hypothetical protein
VREKNQSLIKVISNNIASTEVFRCSTKPVARAILEKDTEDFEEIKLIFNNQGGLNKQSGESM